MDRTPQVDPRRAADASSPSGARVCPYFRATTDGRTLGSPISQPNARNRCAALSIAITPSDRQQELACLTGGHVGCPRFVQGEAARHRGTSRRPLGRATVAAIAAVVLAGAVSVAFVLARGSLELPRAVADRGEATAGTATPADAATAAPVVGAASVAPSPASSAASASTPSAIGSPAATRAPTVVPTARATAAPTPRPTPLPTTAPTPHSTPRPTPDPTAPTPVSTATPGSDRYALLAPCPDQPDCWIYTIRRGDNLFSIANYFGVPLETVYQLNPSTRTTPLRAGQSLILPPPTR